MDASSPSTFWLRSATSRESNCSPSAADAPAGSPRTPLGLTCLHPVRAEVGQDLGQRAGVAGDGGVEPHVLRGEREHHRGLHPARVRVGGQPVPGRRQARTQAGVPGIASAPLAAQLADRVADRGDVAAVAVDEEHRRPVEGGVTAEFHQQSRQSDTADGQRAGEVGVLAARPDRDRRRQPHPGPPRARPARDRRGDPRVGIEREMSPVLLKRPDRNHEQTSRPRLDLGPVRAAEGEPGVPGSPGPQRIGHPPML